MEEMTTLLLQPPPPDPTEFINSKLNDNGNLSIRVDYDSDETLMVTQRLREYRGQRVRGIIIDVQQQAPTSNLAVILENVADFLRIHHFSNCSSTGLSIIRNFATGEQQVDDLLVEAMCDNRRIRSVRIKIHGLPSTRVIQRLIREKSSYRFSFLHLEDKSRQNNDNNGTLNFFAQVVQYDDDSNRYLVACGDNTSQVTNLVRAILTSQADEALFRIKTAALMNLVHDLLLAAASDNDDVNVPHLRFHYPVVRVSDFHQYLNFTELYQTAARHRAVKTIELLHVCVGPLPPIINMNGHNPQQQQCVNNNDPLEKVTLHDCKLLGTQAAHILSLRPIKAFQLIGKGDSNVPDHGDFFNDFFQTQPLLVELILRETLLGAHAMTCICRHVARPDCRIKKLCFDHKAFGSKSTDAQDDRNARDECAAIFFAHLAAGSSMMPSLQYLEFDYCVTSVQVANTIAAGFRSNTTLRKVERLKVHNLHESAPRLQQEIDFFLQCYESGRYLVTRHMDNNPNDDDGDCIPIGLVLFPKVLFRCLSSNQDRNDVVFYFLRQAMPSLVNRLDVRRNRRREGQPQC